MITFNKFMLKILFLSLLVFSCDEEELAQNLFDPNQDDYVPPETTITSDPPSLIITNSTSFSYSGNELVSEYSHRVNHEGVESEWSDWTQDTTAFYDYLDEGLHSFEVKGRYTEDAEDLTAAIHEFEVNAVDPLSARIFPQFKKADFNTTFDIDVYV